MVHVQFNMMMNGSIGIHELSYCIYMCTYNSSNIVYRVQPKEDIKKSLKRHLDWLCEETYYTGLVKRIDARYVIHRRNHAYAVYIVTVYKN